MGKTWKVWIRNPRAVVLIGNALDRGEEVRGRGVSTLKNRWQGQMSAGGLVRGGGAVRDRRYEARREGIHGLHWRGESDGDSWIGAGWAYGVAVLALSAPGTSDIVRQ